MSKPGYPWIEPIILNGSTDDVDYDYDDGEIIAASEDEVDEIIDNEPQATVITFSTNI